LQAVICGFLESLISSNRFDARSCFFSLALSRVAHMLHFFAWMIPLRMWVDRSRKQLVERSILGDARVEINKKKRKRSMDPRIPWSILITSIIRKSNKKVTFGCMCLNRGRARRIFAVPLFDQGSKRNVLPSIASTWKVISVINVIFCNEKPRKWLIDSRRAAHWYIRRDAC